MADAFITLAKCENCKDSYGLKREEFSFLFCNTVSAYTMAFQCETCGYRNSPVVDESKADRFIANNIVPNVWALPTPSLPSLVGGPLEWGDFSESDIEDFHHCLYDENALHPVELMSREGFPDAF